MGNKCSSRHRACGMLAAVCAAILPVVANALDPAIDRIELSSVTFASSRASCSASRARGSPRIGQPGCTRGAGELGAENSA